MLAEAPAWLRANFVALLSLSISGAAFGVSVYAAVITKKHNDVVTRPHIAIFFRTDDDGAGWIASNDGQGPAIVRWFSVYVDNIIQPHWDATTKAIGLPPDTRYRFTSLLPAKSYRGDGAPEKLFWVNDPYTMELLFRNRSRMVIEACYCSVYDKCWKVRSDYRGQPPSDQCSSVEAAQRPPFIEPTLMRPLTERPQPTTPPFTIPFTLPFP